MRFMLALLMSLAACVAEAREPQPFTRGSHQAIVAAHQGRPFVLALWSIDCVYCRDELALLGRLRATYRELAITLVATDSPQQGDMIRTMLHHYRLDDAASWVFADSFVERLRYEIDPQWRGELPRTYLYDADGSRTVIAGMVDAQVIEQWLEAVRPPE